MKIVQKGVCWNIIKVFDAFAGIGGFRSGLEKVGGYEFVGWCEIDKFAQKAYRALYDTGGEAFFENIRTIDTRELPDFDLLTGGFPCQSFSAAGLRRGFNDERGTLFFELARILKDRQPRYFLFENVPNLLGIDKGQTFAKILATLSELGYCVEWAVHNSADFGVPQSRRRIYLAGCLGADCTGKILYFGKFHEKTNRKVKQMIGGSQGQRVYQTDGLAVTQCSGSGGMGGKTGLYWIDMNYPPNFTEKARCLKTRDRGVSHHKGEQSAVFVENSPNDSMFAVSVTDKNGVVHRGRIRRLMPVECWRLQGFTTEQFQKVAETGMSDAQLYKQAGNAVTVNVIEAIGRNLQAFDRKLNL